MKLIHAVTLLIFLSFTTVAAAQERQAFNAIEEMFATMSAYDYDGMAATGTDDYHLLEHGELWTMDDLINAIKGGEGVVERHNFFNVIRSSGDDRSMWFSYWNRADIKTTKGEEMTLNWLESAVVVNVDGEWKVEMLHSTRIAEDMTIPEDVVMTEYVGKNPFKIKD